MQAVLTVALVLLTVSNAEAQRRARTPQIMCEPGYTAICVENTPKPTVTPSPTKTPTTAPTATRTAEPTPEPTAPTVDIMKPTAWITSPKSGQVVPAGPLLVTADANDNIGVTKVVFLYNNTVVCTDTEQPWDCAMNVLPGAITLSVKAYDAANNMGYGEVNLSASGAVPTAVPTAIPTTAPTGVPTVAPTVAPTVVPTAGPVPTPPGPGASIAEMPRVYVNTSQLPTVTGQVLKVNAGGNLQSALNAAEAGDAIELEAGATWAGHYILPVKTGTGQVWIRSSQWQSLPARGTRVKPADASKMAKITVVNYGDPAIRTSANARNYWFTGIEVSTKPANYTFTLIQIGDGNAQVADQAGYVVFDRCYIHGQPGNTNASWSRRGLLMNGIHTAIIDSHVSDFKDGGADTQAIAGWSGAGPFKIVNNYIDGAGENVMFGGAVGPYTQAGKIPADLEMTDNLVEHPVDQQTASLVVKNLFECKFIDRAYIARNEFRHHWAKSQQGHSIVFTPRSECNTATPQVCNAPAAACRDINFVENWLHDVERGINIMRQDSSGPSGLSERIYIANNVFSDDDTGGTVKIRDLFQILSGPVDVQIVHNTAYTVNSGIIGFDYQPAAVRLVVRDNVFANGALGVSGSGAGVGENAFNKYAPDVLFKGNVIYGPWPSSGGMTIGQYGKYQTGNFFPTNRGAVGFVSSTNVHLISGSPYKGKATDNTDPGIK